jgi:PadR family transcriptional regulator, regulatory protein PadR
MTEMLKGILEGIVLTLLRGEPLYGYDLTTRLRSRGFPDIAEGTVYAVLVRIEQKGLVSVEKRPSEKGPPRKVYALTAEGERHLAEFWETWDFLADRLRELRNEGD